MWKYIVIVALVLFAFASYVVYKTHTGIMSSGGEVATLRTQWETAVTKNKEIFMDECIAAYAKMRHEWLVDRKRSAETERERVIEETERVKLETANLQEEYDTVIGLAEAQKAKLDEMQRELQTREEMLRQVLDRVGAEAVDSGSEIFDKISTDLSALDSKKEELTIKLREEESSVEVLQAHKDDLQAKIAKEESIARDRRARISPEELDCSVFSTDPNWDYVIIDRGVDGGVVIGSRLAVLRGDKKICELNVTLVEAKRSSCEIVYSTMITGEAVRPGDRIIAVRANSTDKN